jgi:DNA-binding XRE family transcriptional regulator
MTSALGIKSFPKTQGALVRWARGEETQSAFAKSLGLDRSCVSRYERGELGAPIELIDHCLQKLANEYLPAISASAPLDRALNLTRQALIELETAKKQKSAD